MALRVLYQVFLGPRGPLRTPLVSVVRCPRQKFTQPLIISFPFPSDSKLKQPLPQYTEHRTLNRINSRTFLAQFGLVICKTIDQSKSKSGMHFKSSGCKQGDVHPILLIILFSSIDIGHLVHLCIVD